MAAQIKVELAVGLTDAMRDAMQVASEFSGMKPSQYGRQAILEKLIREGYLRRKGPHDYRQINEVG